MDEQQLLNQFPPAWHVDPHAISEAVRRSGRILVVLDDDPTGTQSVADLPVLTSWGEEDFDWAFDRSPAAVYVMTNSRSLSPENAAEVNKAVVSAAVAAARRRDVPLGFVSRSDSTLRGHFPLETDVLADHLEQLGERRPDGVILAPAFPDAGRVTIAGTHWIRRDDALTPVGDSEFASDATFGYRASNLAEWVEERSDGRVDRYQVVTVDLGTVRRGPDAVAQALLDAEPGAVVAVDAAVEDDQRVLAEALELAESRGRSYLYRVGPPFVRARIGQVPRSPLTPAEIDPDASLPRRGGLIVVGSHVALTSRQLAYLQARRAIASVELDALRVLEGDADVLAATAEEVLRNLAEGDVVLYTSRTLLRSGDPAESLEMSRRISEALVRTVHQVVSSRTPRFVIAKGGITSSDVATRGLDIRRAIARGPMLPGIVSLWEPADGLAVGVPYVVFAGNVGDETSLSDVVDILSTYPAT